MSDIETAVKELNALRQKADRLEGYLRDMRLGAKHEFAPRKIRWRDMVFGFGFGNFHNKAEALPDGMESEFYSFISQCLEDVSVKIRERERVLETVSLAGREKN